VLLRLVAVRERRYQRLEHEPFLLWKTELTIASGMQRLQGSSPMIHNGHSGRNLERPGAAYAKVRMRP
jgi:hypothetical protein